MREGRDVLLVGCGLGTSICLDAAELLAAEGIEATVLHTPTVKTLRPGHVACPGEAP